jgi:hypothetical protein
MICMVWKFVHVLGVRLCDISTGEAACKRILTELFVVTTAALKTHPQTGTRLKWHVINTSSMSDFKDFI